MLRLESMKISGFKSFSDRTEVRFQDGITAVVGPNGCGKSNIGDAINWVLGEQSPKSLRGKVMVDVIFSGSEARKPLGMAEVSLHLDGAEGVEHAEQGKIVVTRRLFRSGESDYLINGKRSRLKDIQEILNQGHVGARTWATIEQGRVDQILNAKPKERRLIIEDAAGIAGYKQKRRLTELKLEATHANLLRVNDIVVEVERQIRSLKRQAAKARRYRRLRDELRQSERVHFGVRARKMDDELDEIRQVHESARDAEAGSAAKLGRLEVELDRQREEIERASAEFRAASERLHEIEIDVHRSEGRITSCRERIADARSSAGQYTAEAEALAVRRDAAAAESEEVQARVEGSRSEFERLSAEFAAGQAALDEAESRLVGLRGEVEELRRRQFQSMNRGAELRNRQRSIEESLERTRTRRSRLESERSDTREDLARLEREGADWAAEMAAQDRRIADLERELGDTEERLRVGRESHASRTESLAGARESEKSAVTLLATLEDVATRFAGVSDGVRTLLGSESATGLRTGGVVADFIEAGAEVESAAEGYLGGFLPTVILEDDGDVRRAAELLRSAGAGRTSLISRSQPAGALAVGTQGNGHSELPPEISADSRVKGRLRDRLTLRASANGVLQDRVGDAVLVDSLEAALDLHRRYPTADYLTAAGEIVYASGVVSAGGRQTGDKGLLAHRRRMNDARTEAARASAEAAALHASCQRHREELEGLERTLEENRAELEAARRRRVELEMHGRKSAEDSERTGRRSAVLADELGALDEETRRLADELQRLRSDVAQIEGAHGELERTLEEQLAVLGRNEAQGKEESERVAGLRAERAALGQRHEAAEQEGRRLSDAFAELRTRHDRALRDAQSARDRENEAIELLQRTERDLTTALEEQRGLATRAEAMEREIEEKRRRLDAREQQLRTLRAELESVRERTREVELARARAEADREHLDELCRHELGVGAADAIEEMPEAVDLERLEREIEEKKQALERIGPVNMTAIDEFSELEERDAFLTSQREDLEKSMVSLKETIRRINRTSRERFLEAFEAIRGSYQEIFQLLFHGGRADLRLEEGEDVLDCGIDIMVQPPGKRLGNVNLMSGGEKALSAIALLFAVFRYQPSPFCLLDEVDAALDDANVTRFTKMLREYAQHTQFVIITHNKLAMESANLLYGVTMDEPGVSRLVSLQMQ